MQEAYWLLMQQIVCREDIPGWPRARTIQHSTVEETAEEVHTSEK